MRLAVGCVVGFVDEGPVSAQRCRPRQHASPDNTAATGDRPEPAAAVRSNRCPHGPPSRLGDTNRRIPPVSELRVNGRVRVSPADLDQLLGWSISRGKQRPAITPIPRRYTHEHCRQLRRTLFEPEHELFRESYRAFPRAARRAVPRPVGEGQDLDRGVWLEAVTGLPGDGGAGVSTAARQPRLPLQHDRGGGDVARRYSGLGFSLHNDVVAPYLLRLIHRGAEAALAAEVLHRD